MAARGTFGNHKLPGFLGNFLSLKVKNVANTNIIYWGGKLLALWEGGLPYKLDPKTLHTDPEEFTLGGLLKKGDALTSHPRVDGIKNRLIAFSSKQDSMKEASIRIFEFDSALNPVVERTFSIQGKCTATCPDVLCCTLLYSAALCCAMLCCAVLYCSVLRCAALRYAVLCYAMLCCAVLYCAMLCYAVQCCAMPCCAMLCYAMQCYAVLYCTVLRCAMLCYAVLCCAILCCAVLSCTVLCSAALCYAVLCSAVLYFTVLCCAAQC